jgi:prepilin-type processing-associated H-X9-DG protein
MQGPRRVEDSRGAFTLVEALVVISVISLLIGLLLPAVQSARESARRVQCRANLRQIGIAMNSYESIHRMFPPGYVDPSGRNPATTVSFMSAFVQVLPQLEQGNLFYSINLSLHAYDSPDHPIVENHTARYTRLEVLLCPSDGEPDHRNSYRLNSGRSRPGNSVRPQPFDGPFAVGVLPWSSAITDGLSETAFVSERVAGSFRKGAPDPARDMKVVDWPGQSLPPDDTYIAFCLDSPAKGWINFEGRHWFYWGVRDTAYNHNGAPNDPRPWCGMQVFGLLPPRSYHPASVNVLFGDGHVRSVPESINQQVWRTLGSYNDGDF